MNSGKEKGLNKRKRPRGQNLAQQPIKPSKPTRGFLFLLSRASARKQTLTARPHQNLARFADERAQSTSSSSSPDCACDHVAAAVMAGDGAV